MLEANSRSFAPIKPLALRWEFPLWQVANDIDTRRLQGLDPQADARRKLDEEPKRIIVEALSQRPHRLRELRSLLGGSGQERTRRLLDGLERDGRIEWTEASGQGGRTRLYRLTGSELDGSGRQNSYPNG